MLGVYYTIKKNPLDQLKRGLAKVKVLNLIIIYFN